MKVIPRSLFNDSAEVEVVHGLLTRYAKLRVAHASWMPGMFTRHRLQRKTLVSDPSMHHGTCVTHVLWCMSGSLTRGDGEKRSRHSRRMRNPQFYVSGKRPVGLSVLSHSTFFYKYLSFILGNIKSMFVFLSVMNPTVAQIVEIPPPGWQGPGYPA